MLQDPHDIASALINSWAASPERFVSFWKGRSRMHLPANVARWSPAGVVEVCQHIVQCTGRAHDGACLLDILQRLPGLGSYLSMAVLRTIAPVFRLDSDFSDELIFRMSRHTAAMSSLDLQTLQDHLARRVGPWCAAWGKGILAVVLCSATKLLLHLGFLHDPCATTGDPAEAQRRLNIDALRHWLVVVDKWPRWQQLPAPEGQATATAMGKAIRAVSIDAVAAYTYAKANLLIQVD
jgi:hypothetical protein